MALSLPNLKDSIDRVLFERMSSPLFGTYLFAWCVWNWKIIYVTLFVDEQQVVHKNKLDFIALELMEPNYIYWYPIYSTIAVLLLYPILSNLSYWLSLQFTKWKRAIKHKWEETIPLTKEESNDIRREYLEKREELKSYIHDIEAFNRSLQSDNQKNKLELTNLQTKIHSLESESKKRQAKIDGSHIRIKELEIELKEIEDQSIIIERLKNSCKRLAFIIGISNRRYFAALIEFYNSNTIHSSLIDDVPILIKEQEVRESNRAALNVLTEHKYAFLDRPKGLYYLTEKGKELWLAFEDYYKYR